MMENCWAISARNIVTVTVTRFRTARAPRIAPGMFPEDTNLKVPLRMLGSSISPEGVVQSFWMHREVPSDAWLHQLLLLLLPGMLVQLLLLPILLF